MPTRFRCDSGFETDRVLLAHMGECIERIREYTAGDRSRFEASLLLQDAAIRNLRLPRVRFESQLPGGEVGAANNIGAPTRTAS